MGQKLSNLKGIFGVSVMDNGGNANVSTENTLRHGPSDSNDVLVNDSTEYVHRNIGLGVGNIPTLGLPSAPIDFVGHNSNSRATGSDKADDIFENIYSNGAEVPKPEEVNGNILTHEAGGSGHIGNSLCSCSLRPENCVCEETVGCQSKNIVPSRNSSEEVGTSYFRRGSTRTPSLVSSKRSRAKSLRSSKDVAPTGSKKKRNHWVLKFNCARLKGGSSCGGAGVETDIPEPNSSCDSCVCTGYRRTEEHHLGAGVVFEATAKEQPDRRNSKTSSESGSSGDDSPSLGFLIDMAKFNPDDYPVEDCDERARLERAREIAEGVEPPPGFCPGQHIQLICPPALTLDNLTALFQTHLGIHTATLAALSQIDVTLAPAVHRGVHTQVDYIHCLVPDLLQITSCSFYWGKMDRYEAERLLEGRPEGTFLLRDSAQEEYLFSVSFRKYGRSLHARIEQWNHHFSFDSHDPGVYASPTVCGLIEHYKDPSCCMFFEPMLTIPLHRNFPFPLQHLCRAVISSKATYDGISQLQLPKPLKGYLKEYHYKQRVRVRIFDFEP